MHDLSGLPQRTVKIENHGTFRVPRYIVRIDIEAPGSGTHGWQVRYQKPWKLISDYTEKRRGPRDSLRAAKEILAAQWDGAPRGPKLKRQCEPRKQNGLPLGISPYSKQRANRSMIEVGFQISVPRWGEKSANRRIYAGTLATITEEKMKRALRKAVRIRREAEREYERSRALLRSRFLAQQPAAGRNARA